MFCSNCGAAVTGNFCSQCGARVLASEAATAVAAASPTATTDWSTEFRYQALIAHPDVREMLTRYASQATKGLSAEEVLEIADKILPLFVAAPPIPYARIGAALAPVMAQVFAQLGISTGKQRSFETPHPVGTVIVAGLCALASHGHPLGAVRQMDDGCLVEAKIPSDVFSNDGTVYVGVHAAGPITHVTLATKIPGQKFDWGKSTRLLNALAADMQDVPG